MGRTVGGRGARLRRVAELLGELAREFEDLAREAEVSVAAGPDQSDITDAPAPDPMPSYISATSLAELLDVAPGTIRRWRREGRLPEPVSLPGVIRWRRDAIEGWLAEQEQREAQS